MNLISTAVCALINSTAELYASSQLLEKKINNTFWIFNLFLCFYLIIGYSMTQVFLRTVILFLVIFVCNFFIYKDENVTRSKSIIISFIVWSGVLLSEALLAIIVVGILNFDLIQILSNQFGYILSNLIIIVLFLILILNNTVKRFIINIVTKFQKFKGSYLIAIALLSTIAFSIIFYLSYFKFNTIITFSLSLIVVIIYTYIIYKMFNEKEQSIKIKNENEILEKSLTEYEKMYQNQRMLNHEHKNEISVIRGLVNKNNKKLIKYIDELIDLKENNYDKWMNQLKLIPEGGLRGLLYYKLSLAEENKIDIDLEIGRNVSFEVINNISDDLMLNLCKIIGVYLDNAIQEVLKLSMRNIKISLYISDIEDRQLVITVMNNFSGNIELDKIDTKGYSTKGKGRGIGLAIVQNVLKNENRIVQSTKIIKNNFMQEIKIII